MYILKLKKVTRKWRWNKTRNTQQATVTQTDRQVEKKTYKHETDSWRQANTDGMCVRETEAIIGKAPRLGIHTPKRHAVIRPCGSFSHRNISGTQWNSQKMAKMWILFRSIDSWARSLGGPWTGWIGSAPVQMNGRCLGAALSWLRDGLLWGLAVPHWRFVSPGTVTLVILGLQVLRAHLLGFCCTAVFPLIFLELCKGPLWNCVELLQT